MIYEMPKWMLENNTPEQLERWMNAGNQEMKMIERMGDYGIMVYDEEDMPHILVMDISKEYAISIMLQMHEEDPEQELELFMVVEPE